MGVRRSRLVRLVWPWCFAGAHLGFEVVRVRRGGNLVGQDEISPCFHQFVTTPVVHRGSTGPMGRNAPSPAVLNLKDLSGAPPSGLGRDAGGIRVAGWCRLVCDCVQLPCAVVA